MSQAESYANHYVAQSRPGLREITSGFATARRCSILRLPHLGGGFGDAANDVYLLTSPLHGSPHVECDFAGFALKARMRPGDFVFQPLQAGCVGHADRRAMIQMMVFDGPWFRSILDEARDGRQIDLEPLAVRTWRDPVTVALQERIWSAMHAGAAEHQPWIDSAVMMIARSLAQPGIWMNLPVVRSRLSLRQTSLLDSYLDTSLAEPIGIPEMATVAGLSPFHFARMFRQTYGVTPHRHLMSLRLRKARDLLRSGPLSLAAIAYATGFSSQSHLTTRFREAFGTTPAAFRRSLR
jgi:AraC family transcriptional regulator